MPYYITDKNSECSNWAVVKEDGELVACHDTKQSAIDQAIAISLSEDEDFVGERNANGDPIIISDIDDTLLRNGDQLIQKTYNYIRSLKGQLFLVTGRPSSTRDKTIADLRRAGVRFSRLVMNTGSTANSAEFKKSAAESLLETYNVIKAIENDDRARGYYSDLGISTINPSSISEQNSVRAAIDQLQIGDYVSWSPLDPKVAAQIVMVEGQLAVVRLFEYEDGIFEPTDKMMVINVFQLEKIPTPKMIAYEVEEIEDPMQPDDSPDDDMSDDLDPMSRMKDLANSIIARIETEESMTKENKWLDVARAIQLKLDGPKPESKEPEVRTNSVDFEVRAEGDGMTFTGYASVFNSPSEDLGGFIEYVAPGAFKRSLQSRNEVKLLWNHDSGEPLASLRGGTMQLVEDEVGLRVTAKLPNTTRGRDIAELLRTKVIDSMSFGFNVIKDSWSRDGQTRTLESVRLFETSIVSFPAYSATTATVRSAPSINADELADALLKLESGEELDEKNANLITEVVSKLKAQPEVQEAEDNGLSILDLKQKQFDLLMKRI